MANVHTREQTTDLTKTASIDSVFIALRSPHMGTKIEVTDALNCVWQLKVQGLVHEDGSGRSLVISGYADLIHNGHSPIFGLPSLRYKAYLNYKGGGRRGWIEIFD